jgi:hypothetical protein
MDLSGLRPGGAGDSSTADFNFVEWDAAGRLSAWSKQTQIAYTAAKKNKKPDRNPVGLCVRFLPSIWGLGRNRTTDTRIF